MSDWNGPDGAGPFSTVASDTIGLDGSVSLPQGPEILRVHTDIEWTPATSSDSRLGLWLNGVSASGAYNLQWWDDTGFNSSATVQLLDTEDNTSTKYLGQTFTISRYIDSYIQIAVDGVVGANDFRFSDAVTDVVNGPTWPPTSLHIGDTNGSMTANVVIEGWEP